MPVDSSIYSNIQQPNMLQQVGQYAGIANALQQNKLLQAELPIRQQQLEQIQMQNQQAQGDLDANEIMATTPRLPNGDYDWNSMLMRASTKPNAIGKIFTARQSSEGSLANAGYTPTGAPILATPGGIAAKMTKSNAPSSVQQPDQPENQSPSDSEVPTVSGGLSPEELEDIKANQASGQKQLSDMKAKAQNGVTIADNAKLADKTLAQGVKTGKFAPAITNLKAALISAGGEKNLPALTGDVSDMQVLGKELARVIQSQGMNDNTDLARLQTDASNTDITKAAPAIHKILQYVQAIGLQNQGAYQGVVATHGANPKGTDVNDYASNFVDPTVPSIYRFLIMSPSERNEFMAQNFTSPASQQAFVAKADQLKQMKAIPQVGQ